ncbi:MAG: Hsp70 family protein [Tindallia sp. MSAO_Bac2]|nr:MAG: Hsp70 family protein [Tindallia sp. MSAO_Bac2]
MEENRVSWHGIDFGTTNSAAVSFTGVDKETVKLITYGDDEGRPLPSLVAINKETGEVMVGREAKERRNELMETCEFITSVKTLLASDKTWIVSGKEWTPTDIATEIFKSLKNRIERNSKEKLEEAVVAVPVGFPAKKKKELRKASNMAGFKIKVFISEPTAAFCSNYHILKNCNNVAVFDWGGGTLDVAIINVSDGKIKEMATSSMYVAGNDIDIKFAKKMHARFTRNKTPVKSFEELNSVSKDQLLAKCEKAKCDFSDEDLVSININRYDDYGVVRDTIDYDFFNLLVEKETEDASICLANAIKKARLNSAEIDAVLCVGGSSKLRPLKEKLIYLYGKEKVLYPEKVMWDIAKGASMIAMNPGDYGLAKPIGLVLSDGSFFPLLNEGQRIPCKEMSITLGIVEESVDARYIFSDAALEADRTFTTNFVVPIRGFMDEKHTLSCYVDPDFIFRLKIESNRASKDVIRVWTYEDLKMYYRIGDAF